MSKKGIAIRYGDVAPEAKENFYPSSNDSEFETLYQLQRYNQNFPNYSNPCEFSQVVLDGAALPIPSDPSDSNIGFWSKSTSGENGEFATPIELNLKSEFYFSSKGITFTFDTDNGIYPQKMSIKWINSSNGSSVVLDEKEYIPNNAFYFCENDVADYNEIVVLFYSLNMPNNRLKVRSIDYGYGTYFYKDSLLGVRCIQEISPISAEVSINTVDFDFETHLGENYSFRSKQPISVYFDGKLIATTFIKKAKRKSKTCWSVQSEDYIGMMDGVYFEGGVYSGKRAKELLEEIFNAAKVPFSIENDFDEEVLSGHIPYTTCRDALMQVAFAIQAVVDTSNSDVVKVFSLKDDLTQKIDSTRIMQGQYFSDDEIVTGVELSSHAYLPIQDEIVCYDANESGAGDEIFVSFSQPLHSLDITNGVIIRSGNNFAVINAYEQCVLKGKKYDHTVQTKRKTVEYISRSESEKIVSIVDATLVSRNNVDKVLDKCYNYITKSNSTNIVIVEGKKETAGKVNKYGAVKYGSSKYGYSISGEFVQDQKTSVGDLIQYDTEYLGVMQGIIEKQTFNLNGGVVLKNSIVK